jgi:hypothetical protein
MATLEECERAFQDLAGMLTRMDADKRQKTVLDRSLSCKLRDLDVIFAGQLRNGGHPPGRQRRCPDTPRDE